MRKLPTLCSEPSCPEISEPDTARCAAHRRGGRAVPSKGSGSYGRGWWVRLRKRFLALHPLCSWCGDRAVTVDHIVPRVPNSPYAPHGQDSEGNLQSLCRSCAGRKTASYDGAYGNPRRPYAGPLPEKSERSA
jgi:5-methylcytosine-specific restriction protein A